MDDWWGGLVGRVGGKDDHVITQVDSLLLVYAMCTYVYE